MNKEWSDLCKKFQREIAKEKSFNDGIKTLLHLRKCLYDMLIMVKNGFPLKGYSLQPLAKSTGYDCKTMIYSIYHTIRIEDIVCNTLLRNKKQIFFEEGFNISTKSSIITTGNELCGNQIEEFSKHLDVNEIYKYLTRVYETTNEYIASLHFKDLKTKVTDEAKKRVIESKCVSENENAVWLIDYWCGKDTLGLLKMPFSRHWIMHTEAFLKIKNALIQKAKKVNKNQQGACGNSCKHCFLSQWCAGCRSEYNCCSYAQCDGGTCSNLVCSTNKKIEGCYECDELSNCVKGFYKLENNGHKASKANAEFIKKHGKIMLYYVLGIMNETYDFYTIQQNIESSDDPLRYMEEYLNKK